MTVASLTSVIMPSGLIVTRESRLDSIIDRAASKSTPTKASGIASKTLSNGAVCEGIYSFSSCGW